MDAVDFLNKEYENIENFNTRTLLQKLGALEQYVLIELMNKYARQLANDNPTSQEQLAAPAVSKSVSLEGRGLLLAFSDYIIENECNVFPEYKEQHVDDFLSQQ